MSKTDPFHPLIRQVAKDFEAGLISRRMFLSQSTALGVSAACAVMLAGRSHPAQAQAQPAIRQGGTLRIQQSVKALKDPRAYDWSELGNQTRGFLEYLVEYQRDGRFVGMLLRDWEVNEDATQYRLHLRQGVRWNNGDPFTASDVAHNVARWCDSRFPGNSMSSRMTALSDPATGQMREDALSIEDAHTVRLDLSMPDVTLIANLSDYPAAIVHPSFEGDDPFAHGIGTGPFRPVDLAVGESCVLERHPDHIWWGSDVLGGPYLDRIEFVDYGTDPAVWVAAAEADEVDLLYESVGDFIDILDAQGWVKSTTETAATCVIRANQTAEIDGQRIYSARDLRHALALATENSICLELGYGGRGSVAANHHVSPMQPDYADIGPAEYDPEAARALVEGVSLLDFEHELITVDDEWQRNTGDAVAAQLRDAGLTVRRRIIPGNSFWQSWKDYPLSLTQWNHRPLAVQVLALAYRSGAAWNESGFANAEFDALLDQAMAQSDESHRQATMARLEALLRDEAVIIQPYWRRLYNHHNGRVLNAEKHPSHEIHLYKIGFTA